MTDVRCSNCGNAFFSVVGLSRARQSGLQAYRCRNCSHPLLVKLEETSDPNTGQFETASILQCLDCGGDVFDFITRGSTMEGDTEDGFQCDCRKTAYMVRTCHESTATSPSYEEENPFTELRQTGEN